MMLGTKAALRNGASSSLIGLKELFMVRPSNWWQGLFALVLWLCPATLLAVGDSPLVLEEIDVFGDGDFLLAPLTIAGKQQLFVLDTGSDCCVYDIALLTGKPQQTVRGNAPDGSVELKLFTAPQMLLGKTPLVGRPLVAGADLTEMRETQGYDIRGILGMDVLRQYVIRIDFDRGKLYFQRAAGPTASTPVLLIFQPSSPLPYLAIRLAGLERPMPFRVDTGMLPSGVLRKELAEELVSKRGAAWWSQSHATTLSGGTLKSVWRIDEVQLQSWRHALYLREGNVNSLGLDYLSRFNITFDFPKEVAYFSKSQNFDHATRLNMTGIRLSQIAGRTWVHAVAEKSAAASAGIRQGDEVVAIDGYATAQTRLKILDDRLSANEKSLSFRLVRNGMKLEISLPRTKATNTQP